MEGNPFLKMMTWSSHRVEGEQSTSKKENEATDSRLGKEYLFLARGKSRPSEAKKLPYGELTGRTGRRKKRWLKRCIERLCWLFAKKSSFEGPLDVSDINLGRERHRQTRRTGKAKVFCGIGGGKDTSGHERLMSAELRITTTP